MVPFAVKLWGVHAKLNESKEKFCGKIDTRTKIFISLTY